MSQLIDKEKAPSPTKRTRGREAAEVQPEPKKRRAAAPKDEPKAKSPRQPAARGGRPAKQISEEPKQAPPGERLTKQGLAATARGGLKCPKGHDVTTQIAGDKSKLECDKCSMRLVPAGLRFVSCEICDWDCCMPCASGWRDACAAAAAEAPLSDSDSDEELIPRRLLRFGDNPHRARLALLRSGASPWFGRARDDGGSDSEA